MPLGYRQTSYYCLLFIVILAIQKIENLKE